MKLLELVPMITIALLDQFWHFVEGGRHGLTLKYRLNKTIVHCNVVGAGPGTTELNWLLYRTLEVSLTLLIMKLDLLFIDVKCVLRICVIGYSGINPLILRSITFQW